MHYYQFNIADYRKDTIHLSHLEHGIYRQLLDEYYLNEKPIKTQQVIRRLRILTQEEKTALENVLNDFFEHDAQEDSWSHKRAEESLEAYKAKAEISRVNGSKGGRPKKPKKTQQVNSGLPKETQAKGNHKPETINQKPISNTTHTSISSESDTCGGEILEFAKKPQPVIPYQKIIDCYQRILPSLPRVAKLSDARKSKIKARWNNDLPDLEEWAKYFMAVSKSDFLMGRAAPNGNRSKPFQADIDFLITESNMIKVIEGKYHA